MEQQTAEEVSYDQGVTRRNRSWGELVRSCCNLRRGRVGDISSLYRSHAQDYKNNKRVGLSAIHVTNQKNKAMKPMYAR